MQNYEIHVGDCVDVMEAMAAEGQIFDSIVTDPPYGLSERPPDLAEVLRHWLRGDDYEHRGGGFMGQHWDRFVPGPSVWRAALELVPPGGHLVCFAGARTYDLMATSIRLGGWEVRDQLGWAFGSGFPKSMNVAAKIDKRRHDRDQVLRVTRWIAAARDRAGLTNPDVDRAFGYNGMAGHWTSQKTQPSVPTLEQVPRLLDVLGLAEADVPDDIRRLLVELNGLKGTPGEAWRQAVTVRVDPRAKSWEFDEAAGLSYSVGEREHKAPNSEAAREWAGWGTALKPAWEPIVLARRPLGRRTTIDAVQEFGTGALNIDGCRVGFADDDDRREATEKNRHADFDSGPRENKVYGADERGRGEGRFPANVLHDGSDDVLASLGEASRFFYCAKAQRGDREEGLDALDEVSPTAVTGRAEGSAGQDNPRAGMSGSRPRRNTHPTVKPTALMWWLVRLVTRRGGSVLDPFCGSGSTGKACALEGLGFAGVDYTERYATIASHRIAHVRGDEPLPGEIEGFTGT